MDKIVYASSLETLEEPMASIAREEGLEVIPAKVTLDMSEQELRELVESWKASGIDAVLCRGTMEAVRR